MTKNDIAASWLIRVGGVIGKGGLILTIVLAAIIVPLTLWFGWTRNGIGFETLIQTAFCGSFIWFLVATLRWSRSFGKLTGASSAKLLLGPRPENFDERDAWRWGRHCRWAFLAIIVSMAGFGLTLWFRGK